MKISHLIKLTGVVMALSVLPLQSSFAECPCGHSEDQDQQDKQFQSEANDFNNTDPNQEMGEDH